MAPSEGAVAGSDFAEQARAHYQRAMKAQQSGDWARYGEEIRRLGEALSRLPAPPPQ